MSLFDPVISHLQAFQRTVVQTMETLDGSTQFLKDAWERPESNVSGLSCVIEDGRHIERGGVNFSHLRGEKLPSAASDRRPDLKNRPFEVAGVSIVFHPRNPYAPTSHMNVRLFAAYDEKSNPIWWFGGGFDLTPYYGFEEDCVLWHEHARAACEVLSKNTYPEFKAWCDRYFYLKHRNEPRGIGGIFYDDLNQFPFEQSFAFHQAVATNYLKAYVEILKRRIDMPYGETERQHQLNRRGRYVEFNLVYDRGTLFGLQTNGRTESILMSLPPLVTWGYAKQPEENSEEARLYRDFLKIREWV